MRDRGDPLSARAGAAPPAPGGSDATGPIPLASADGLAAGYGGPPAVSGVRFAVEAGERVAVLGPNGGGNTTLFRVLLGQLDSIEGRLDVNAAVATVPQTERSRLDFPVNALDVALMGSLSRLPWWRRPGRDERRRARAALDAVGMAEQADASFGELSGGQRQRVLIARALVQDAALLLLDEPFSGLDAASGERLDALLVELAAQGRGVMMATHDLDQARAWDLVLCLNRAQVAFGPPGEVLTRATIERTYGAALVEVGGEGDERALAILPPHHHDHAPEEARPDSREEPLP
jgi:ABC-type Mn2+/Zn2+ transport system ATPase subunit